jgi:excisionase family DNA binding protein
MRTSELREEVPTEQEAEMAKVAQRCIMAALDHSRANKILLISEDEDFKSAPVLELPPKALRFFADMLGMMAQQKPIALVPQNHEVTTQEAAIVLNVSRPFVVKLIESGQLKCRKVGRHRRIEFAEVLRMQETMKKESDQSLQDLASISQELDMGY